MLNRKIIGGVLIPCLCAFTGVRPTQDRNYRIVVNYNGQADLLLSLQIPPDYYPYQFKRTDIYDYLSDIKRYIVSNDKVSKNKKEIANQIQGKLNSLFKKVKEFGPSLWNRDLYDTGIVFRNDQFWGSKKTSILFIEQFIADDYVRIQESYNLLPVHKDLIITNYRAARDPYTIFKSDIFDCFKRDISKVKLTKDTGDSCKSEFGKKFKEYMKNYNKADINSIYRFGKYMDFWNELFTKAKDELDKLGFSNLIKQERLFSLDQNIDQILFKKYHHTLFTEEEKEEFKGWENNWKPNYQTQSLKINQVSSQTQTPSIQKTSYKPSYKLTHHPALEQQILPGSAPLAEGSQKDIVVFLYQFAALIDKYVKTDNFKKEFEKDYRKEKMKKALENTQKMSKNINERIKNIREYFKKIEVVDKNFDPDNHQYTNTNSKTFTVLTYPPTSFGAGDSTIQSMSKFPFIYQDIGLRQPVPSDIKDEEHNKEEFSEEDIEHWSFSVDDNGWWWKIGNANLDPKNMLRFSGISDTLLLLANEDDWNLLNDFNSSSLRAASVLLKNKEQRIDIKKINSNGYPVSYNKYHLWNEGLRSPIALNLLLDNLVEIFQRQYDPKWSKDDDGCYKKAMDWGDYWLNEFIKNSD